MKKITIRNSTHNTEARVYVPEHIVSTLAAMAWLEEEGERERENFGYYAKARKRYLELRRALCKIKGCQCTVRDEVC